MTHRWIGQLFKVADIVMEIKANQLYWDKTQHEPLILGIFFPFLSCSPCHIRNTPALLDIGMLLRRVWREREGTEGDILQKLCTFTQNLGHRVTKRGVEAATRQMRS